MSRLASTVLKQPEEEIMTAPQQNAVTSRSWIVWGAAVTFYLYEYILRVSPSVMTDELMLHFGVTAGSLGALSSFYYYAYVPLQIPGGVIVDKLGPRRVVTLSALLCVIGALMFSQCETLLAAQVGRLLIGAGSACAFISCLKIGAEWFPISMFALLAGVTQAMGTLGGTFGGRPFAILVDTVGWQQSMIYAAIAGTFIVVLSWLFIRDTGPNEVARKDDGGQKPLLEGLKVIVSNPQSWLIGIYGGLMYVPISAFAELWAVPYLKQLYAVDKEIASTVSVMVFIGVAIGCPMAAKLSDRFQSRLKVMSWSALTTAILFSIAFYVPMPLMAMVGLLLLAGIVCGGQILYFPAAKEINPPDASGATVGFTNCLVMVSGIIFQPLLGKVLDLAWDGNYKADGAPFYTTADYQEALIAVPACLIVAWVLLKFVKETYPKTAEA